MPSPTKTIANHKTTIRLATPSDDPFVFELYKTTRAMEMGMVDWDSAQKEHFLQMQFQAQQTHYQTTFPDADHHLILLNSKPIGRIYVDRADNEIRLLDIILLPTYRNQGIGSFYLQQLKDEAAQTKIPVRFYVWQLNHAALRFYHRHGFHAIEDVGAYVHLQWQPQ